MTPIAFLRRLAVATILIAGAPALADQGETAPGPVQPVSLTAVVVTGAKPLPGARFTVIALESGKSPPVKATSDQGPAMVELPVGRYRVIASYGDSKAEQEIVVGLKPTSHEISLNAGTAVMRLIKHVGGPVLRQGVSWEILTFGKDANGNRQIITSSSEAQPKFTLPKGYYVAQAKMGTRDVRHTIEVTAGVNYKYTVILQ